MLNAREDVTFNAIAKEEKNNIEGSYAELKLRNEKWLINCLYQTMQPNQTMINTNFDALSKYRAAYEVFRQKQPTGYKNLNSSKCIEFNIV